MSIYLFVGILVRFGIKIWRSSELYIDFGIDDTMTYHLIDTLPLTPGLL